MIRPSVSFQLGDVITGEPHLDYRQRLAVQQHLPRLEQEPRESHLRASVAAHLPRIILIAWGAAGILLWLAGLATAGGPAAGRTTPECAERDLKVITLIEAQGEAQRLPAAVLAAAGFAQMDARLMCLSGRPAEALAQYDAILAVLGLPRQATR